MTELDRYPKQIQNAIKNNKKMTRQDIVNYFDDLIKNYEEYNKNNPNMEWAKDYPEAYKKQKQETLNEFDKEGMACYSVYCTPDIDVYLYTDGTYQVYCDNDSEY